MNRAQIVDAISNETGVTKKDVEMVVTSFSSTVKDSVQRGDDIQLIGFGAFKKVSKAARKCRNPKTGETIKVPARKAAKFYPGKAFTEQVNTKAKAKKK